MKCFSLQDLCSILGFFCCQIELYVNQQGSVAKLIYIDKMEILLKFISLAESYSEESHPI